MSDELNKLTLNRAKTAVMSRDYTLAEGLFKSLLGKEPDNLEILEGLGNLYMRTEQYEEALNQYNQVLAIDSKNLTAINNLGSIYRNLKRYRDSVSILEQGIIIDEYNIQLFYNLGLSYKDMEKYKEALQCFNMVVTQNPNDVLAYNHLGFIYLEENEPEKAIESLSKGIKIDPNHPVLHLNLAKAYKAIGSFDASSKEYEAALRSKPGWLEAIDSYADLLLEEENNDYAQKIVEQALNLDPDNAGMHTKMGHVYSQRYSYENAEVHYNEALRLEPNNIEALSCLASAYESDGKLQEALHTMEAYEKLSPDDVNMLRQYTHILLTDNKLNSAYDKIKQVWNKNPDDVKTLNLLGQYYICNGEDTKADGCFKRIAKLDPTYVAYYKDGALRYTQKGEYDKAEQNLKKYLNVRPDDTQGAAMLASSYEKQNRYGEAHKMYSSLAQKHSNNSLYRNKLSDTEKWLTENGQADKLTSYSQDLSDQPYDYAADESMDIDDRVAACIGYSSGSSRSTALDEETVNPEEMNLGYNMESLTQNDDTVSPFEQHLDDEIMASHADDNSLDALIPQDESLEQEDDDDDDNFFRNNAFSSGVMPRPLRENRSPVFEEEEFDDREKEPDSISLDEDVEKEPPKKKRPAPKPRRYEPEPEPEYEEEDYGEEDNIADDVPQKLPEDVEEEEESFEEISAPEPDEDDEISASFEDEDISNEEEDRIEELSEDVKPEKDEDMDTISDIDDINHAPEKFEVPQVLDSLPDVEDQLSDMGLDDTPMPSDDDDESEISIEELNKIIVKITDLNIAKKYENAAELFKKLRELADSLPDNKRKEFYESEAYLLLEYFISYLHGTPGLMAVSQECRKKIDWDDEEDVERPDDGLHGKKLAITVFENMKTFLKDFKDNELSVGLDRKISSVLDKLKNC